MIVSAGTTELFPFAEPIGMGLVESAYTLSRLLYEKRPSSLTFVGSCGSYGRLTVFETIYTSSATQIEASFLQNSSYTPIEQSYIVSHETIVNSSNYITTDAKNASSFLKYGLDVENMEFFSVVSIAKKLRIPVKGFFVVTNYCDATAHEQYCQHMKQSNEIINEAYIKGRFEH